MTEQERTGEFTYKSYRQHLLDRLDRTLAEIDGFDDAKLPESERRGTALYTPSVRDSYTTGLYLGQMYLAKQSEEGSHANSV